MTRAERIRPIEHLEQHFKQLSDEIARYFKNPDDRANCPAKLVNHTHRGIATRARLRLTNSFLLNDRHNKIFLPMFLDDVLRTNNRVICMHHSKRYSKDLTHLTTFRISPALREQAERAAEWCGISFSDFVRQSITRNIFVSRSIEEEVTRKTAMLAMGYKE